MSAHKKSGFIQHHRAGAGFTLIELLVVISIIGILATLVAANLNAARSRARDAERKSDLANMRTALRLYYNDNGSYPASNYFASLWGQQWKVGSAVYINTLPKDPLSPTQDYQYKIGTLSDSPAYSSTDSFTLVACLENLSDTSGVTTPSQFSCPNSEKAFVVSQ